MKRILVSALSISLLWPAAASAEIVVGFVTGLSGAVSSIGIPIGKGIAAGQTYRGEIDGEAVRVIELDDASDPSMAARNTRKLVEQEKVDALIGTSGAPQTVAMATIAVELKVPMVAVSPITPPPTGEGGPWVVQSLQPQLLLFQGIVGHMKANKVKTVAFIGFNDALGDLMYSSLVESAKEAGINIVANERYARTETSVTGQVLKIVSQRPDAVVIGGTATPAALPAIGLTERGYKGLVYGNNGMISADFLRVAGKAANGIICPTGPVIVAEQLPDSNPTKKVALAYREAYQKANSAPAIDGFSPYAFDGWLILTDAIKRAKATGAKSGTPEFRAAIRAALYSTKELAGAYGVYNFVPASTYGVDERSVTLVKIDNGAWKLLSSPTP
ncbi:MULTISPECIES: ABC transporter substrate-binding protein [unclassified Beijerinckia]|uniref:ABC transporter substrate-binding protein n=1 Tax=unclassified Beijerinckia TaxID=2638183 RepID=UPI00089CF96D|nr:MULTISPECIES: ABC transporter substrate-binding protein [unclassified Beijerinckia]MDH7797581.1 branched-chain amino acid transport system substrate-binding protein [Beijerinckia sp. GAS462]SEC91266.1 amino acid/amide ABC transporter substrate-binding protein, HAAT family [Beijerinckia sp. 28-YEA-48]